MAFRFPQPSNEDDFELFCLRFLRELWQCPTLQQYGKRGERQHGIDLIDEAGVPPLRGVQAKHHESNKTIPPSEIEDEVQKALGSGLPLNDYYILTTGRRTAQSQNAVIRINRDHMNVGRFKVFVWTWSDIEAHLSEMDDMAQERVIRGDTGRSGPAIGRMMVAVMAEHFDRPLYASASALDTEMEGIQHVIDRHEFEVAETKLRELEMRAADKLQPHHRYQLKALRSRIFSSRWQWEQAGRVLLDAKRFMPETDRARINEALGHELMGDRQKAHALATELRREFPHNIRLLTIWVRTAPLSIPFSALTEIASTPAIEDEELCLALAHRALAENRIAESLSFGRRAAELEPNSPQAWLIIGQAKHVEGHSGVAGVQAAPLREAEQHYDRAVRLASEQKMPGLEAAARFNRGQVRHLLGDSRAESDLAIAVDLAPSDQELRTSYAGYLQELGRYNDALRELTVQGDEPTSARLFYEAAARHDRNVGNDRQQAVALLHRVILAGPAERWDDAHILLVQWAVESNSTTDARRYIQESTLRDCNPLVFHTLSAWLSSSDGDAGAAREALGAALHAVTSSSSRGHVFLLAQGLVSIGDDDSALPLLLRCYRPGVFNVECRKLLDCAHRLNRDDISSRLCRELREAGETDSRIVLTEIDVLQRYDPQEALWVAQEYLDRHPDNRHVALWQSALALRLDRQDLLISDLGRLPPPDDVTPEGSSLVINILCATDRPTDALRYAYQTLRAHFDKEFAHRQFIAHFLRLSPQCQELRISGRVGPGTAVCYRELHRKADQWVIIEDESEPDLAMDELGRDHALSQALAGRRVGDMVTLPGSSIQPRAATIRDVVHKCLYRFRDCLNRYQARFPGGSACQVIHVGSGEAFDPTPIVRSLEDRRQQIETLDNLYITQPMPLHTYAKLSGVAETDAWTHLASSHDLGIRSFNGQSGELTAGLERARQSTTIVVDLTAVLTLAHLGLLRTLRSDKRSILVAQTTFDRMRHLAEENEDDATERGSVVLAEDGQLARVEITAEQRERHRAFLTSMRDAVRENCQIRPCLGTAELNPQRRQQLIEALGRHNLDSILLASGLDTVLWTDDLILGIISRTDFQASRVWTQVMLFVLHQEGTISRREYDQAIAKLIGWYYHGVLWSAETLIAAAEIAEWQMQRWPVPQAMQCLGNREANPLQRIRIAADAIRAAWCLDLDMLRKQSFLFAVLSGIGSISLVRRLQQMIPTIFSVDVLSASDVMDCISVWLRYPTGGLLQP